MAVSTRARQVGAGPRGAVPALTARGTPQITVDARRAEMPAMTARRWEILAKVAAAGPSTAKAIADATDLTEQAVSRHLSALFRATLIAQDPEQGLQRPRRWVITDRGRNLLGAARS